MKSNIACFNIFFFFILIFSLDLFAQEEEGEEPDLSTTIEFLEENWAKGDGEVLLNDESTFDKYLSGYDKYYSNIKTHYSKGAFNISISRKTTLWKEKIQYQIDLDEVDLNSIKITGKNGYCYLVFNGKVKTIYTDEFSESKTVVRRLKNVDCQFRWKDETAARRIKKALKHAVKLAKGPTNFFDD